MKLPNNPRVYLSGGATGLGRAIALKLAERQARILIADVNLEEAERTAEDVRQRGGEAVVRRCDVTKADEIEAAAQDIEQRWGGVDLVVNNAGVAAGGAMGELPLADWQWIVGVNLWGVIHGCHVFAPRLVAQKSGFLLNVASAAGFASLPQMSAYNVTKAGVIALSETLYSELGEHGVQVSVLCPTFFQSELMRTFRSPDAGARRRAEAFFARSKVTSEDVARAAIEGLEQGRAYIVPQLDGRFVWAMKRLLPGRYLAALRRFHRAGEAKLVGADE